MDVRKFFGKKKTTTKPRRRVRVMPHQIKEEVTRVVKRQVGRTMENKKIGWTIDVAQHNSAISTADCYPVLQLIPKGDYSYNRDGDRIKPKSLIVRGVVSLVNTANQPNNTPIFARIVIAAQKDVKVATSTNTQCDAAHLLRPATPGADQLQFTGQLLQLNYPVNDLKFRVYMDKVVKLTPVTTASLETRGTQSYRFYKRIPCPASLTFDAGNLDSPNNFAPFYALGYAYQDGTSPDVLSTRIFSSVSSILTFED